MLQRKSLLKAQDDVNELHSPAWRVGEEPRKRLYGEHVPHFYSGAGNPIPLEGSFTGGCAFLMANGPSVKDLDLTALQRAWVMTLNNGPKTFRGSANCTVDEPSRFSLSTWLDPTIMKFMPMAHFSKKLWDNRLLRRADGQEVQLWEQSKLAPGDCPNVIGYRRNEKFHAPRWLWEETINWGNHKNHGGGRSVLLASLRILFVLGFRRVFLIGVDFEMTEARRYHFDEQRTGSAVRGNMDTYAKLQDWLQELQPLFLKAGFEVHNCNPKSRLTAFPHLPYGEALDMAVLGLGNVQNERTEGMYQKLEEKLGVVEGVAQKEAPAGGGQVLPVADTILPE